MGIIREPLDVDFVVDPRPLTDKERKMIGDFIKAHKLKRAKASDKLKSKRTQKRGQTTRVS